jgi:hypothetical protein
MERVVERRKADSKAAPEAPSRFRSPVKGGVAPDAVQARSLTVLSLSELPWSGR